MLVALLEIIFMLNLIVIAFGILGFVVKLLYMIFKDMDEWDKDMDDW